MTELAEIDQQLDALGKPLPDVRNAIEQLLGDDRSLAKLDEILSGLGEVPPGMLKPRPSALPPSRRSRRTSDFGPPPAQAAAPPPPPYAHFRTSDLPPSVPPPAPEALQGEDDVSSAAIGAPSPFGSPLEAAPPSPMPLPFTSPLDPPPTPPTPLPVALPTDPLAPVQLPASSWPPRGARGIPPRIVTPTAGLRASVPAPSSAAWPPLPVAPLPRITDTLVDTPLAPLPAVGSGDSDLDAETAALLGDGEPPPPAFPSAVPLPFGPSVETSVPQGDVPTRVGPAPDELADEQARQAAREKRDSMRALLDQEIDPKDFPSVPPPAAAPAEAKPEDDDVEMLLDDEEIIEIQDDEFEEIE